MGSRELADHPHPLQGKTVVVTGNQGFIGGHLHHALIGCNARVIGLDKKSGSDILTMPLPPADWCFHLAAETNAQSDDRGKMFRTNYWGTQLILEAYRKNVVFTSTCAINYPGTPYAESKLFAEKRVHKFGGRVVRLCNIFGPGGHGVIDRFVHAPVLHIRGDGSQIRTYAHVNRAVEALLRQVEEPPGSLHILPGADLTVREIAETFFPYKHLHRAQRLSTDIQNGVQVYSL